MNTVNGLVKEDIYIEVSQDKMIGVISFSKEQENAMMPSLEEVKAALREKGITTGIMETELIEVCKAHTCGYKYVIAKGKMPKDGQDGYIDFAFDVKALKQLKPKENVDGTVDLRDLGAVKNVKSGDHLATKVFGTQGEEGFNVLGQVLKAKRGKEARMPKGRNTKVLEDGVTLVADIDGKLEYDDHNIYINSVYTVHGDLDSSVGNIDFVGSVVVHGSIHSGFSIKAGGSVEVHGPVEDAVIIAGEDVVLSYGIQGSQKSKIIAKGNVATKFIQNTYVEAGGNVITEAILHSKVTAGDGILVEVGKGTIVGGEVSATNLVIAKSIGSPMGTSTGIKIGVPPSTYAEFKALGEEMKEKNENLNKIDQSLKFLLAKKQKGELPPEQLGMLQKLTLTRGPLVEEYEEVKARHHKVREQLNQVESGIIKCNDRIYPGVKIVFGNLIKYIDEQCIGAVINKSDGDIKVGV